MTVREAEKIVWDMIDHIEDKDYVSPYSETEQHEATYLWSKACYEAGMKGEL